MMRINKNNLKITLNICQKVAVSLGITASCIETSGILIIKLVTTRVYLFCNKCKKFCTSFHHMSNNNEESCRMNHSCKK